MPIDSRPRLVYGAETGLGDVATDMEKDGNIPGEMKANLDAFLAAVEGASAVAKKAISDAAEAYDVRHRSLLERLVSASIPVPSFSSLVARPADPVAKAEQAAAVERRSARAIWLRTLYDADGPIYGNVLDDAVTSEGWSKAASDKMRSKLQKEGLVACIKRQFTLTEKGRLEMSGEPSETGMAPGGTDAILHADVV